MWKRRAVTVTIGLGLLLAACGGSGLSDAEKQYCLVQGPTLMVTADARGFDLEAVLDNWQDAIDAAEADGATHPDALRSAQSVLESDPSYIAACRDLYEHR